jgi:hypothetical protein
MSGPPTGLAQGTSYELVGRIDDPILVNPISWDWYVDGQFVGTTSDEHFSGTVTGSPGSEQEIDAVVADYDGQQRTAAFFIPVCNGTFTC